jgi:HlyD family secretion protein
MEGNAQRRLQPGVSEPQGSAMDRAIVRRPTWSRLIIPVGVVVLLFVIGAATLLSHSGRVYRVPLDRLSIAAAEEGLFEDFIPVRATVAPYLTAYLTTDQGGTVRQVLVEDGATVKSGQALIVLSNPALQLQVAAQQLVFEQTRFQYQRDLLDIEHHISKLQGDLTRDKILLDGNAIAPSTYTQEQEEYDYYKKLRAATMKSRDVEQNVRTTQLTGSPIQAGPSAGDIANAGINALTIRAPMDGQLSALDAEVGQSKAQGAVLGQVNAADRFKLTAQVDEFHLGRVAIGQEALFTVSGRDYKAKIAKVYPQVVNGAFKVDLYFDALPPSGIHVGQAIDLKVELGGASSTLMIANGPFYQDTGGNWAFVLLPDGQSAIKRPIRLGRRNPQFVEVIDGLRAGDKVVVSGYEAYQKMDRLVIERHSATH